MTDQYAVLGPDPAERAVTLVVQADYHLDEMDRVVAALAARGLAARVLVPVIAWKPLYSFRPTVRRLRQLVAHSGRSLGDPIGIDALVGMSSVVMVMNDWGVPRALVDAAKTAGLPTAALVEGVQDYEDVDTGLDRSAYRRVDHVFTLGEAGAETLGRDRCTPVGSERVAALFDAPVRPAGSDVVVNSNFTYGVMTDVRRSWVDGAITAAEAADRAWALSRHVAERGRSNHRVDQRPIADLLATAGSVVSRFSTVALDALALGVELVYHNPHGEREPTFQTDVVGFRVTTSVDELTDVLRSAPRDRAVVRAEAEPFLRRHLLLDPSSSPADRVAAGLIDLVG